MQPGRLQRQLNSTTSQRRQHRLRKIGSHQTYKVRQADNSFTGESFNECIKEPKIKQQMLGRFFFDDALINF